MQTSDGIDLAQIWGFLFLLLGPIKIIGPFVRMTNGVPPEACRAIALKASFFATSIVLLAATGGVVALHHYAVPAPVLALTGGLLLFLVALQALLQHLQPRAHPVADPASPHPAAAPPNAQLPIMPLAYPIIVPPSGIAAVIIFMTLAPGLPEQATILALMLGILTLDLLVMIFARPVLRWLGMPLLVLGSVLGVVQAALGLNIMLRSLRLLGVIGGLPG